MTPSNAPEDPSRAYLVVDPPYAKGHSFASLADYVEYLRRHNAPIDGPWYEEVRPGVFVLRRGNFRPLPDEPQAVDEEISRDALAAKLGFSN